MAQAMVSFRMDAELKKTTEEICKGMGLTLTSAFTMFAAKVSQERAIPFKVGLPPVDPFHSEENLSHIEHSLDELDRGEGIEMSMQELEEFMNAAQ